MRRTHAQVLDERSAVCRFDELEVGDFFTYSGTVCVKTGPESSLNLVAAEPGVCISAVVVRPVNLLISLRD